MKQKEKSRKLSVKAVPANPFAKVHAADAKWRKAREREIRRLATFIHEPVDIREWDKASAACCKGPHSDKPSTRKQLQENENQQDLDCQHAQEKAELSYKEIQFIRDIELSRFQAAIDAPIISRLNHNRRIAGIGGRASARYSDAKIIAALTAYKKRCGKMSLTSAISNIICETKAGSEYLKYDNPSKVFSRLKKIAHPKTPSAWWKAL